MSMRGTVASEPKKVHGCLEKQPCLTYFLEVFQRTLCHPPHTAHTCHTCPTIPQACATPTNSNVQVSVQRLLTPS